MSAGERDLGRILETIEVRRRTGVFVYVTVPPGHALPDLPLAALVAEVEGTTLVVERDLAVDAGVLYDFEAAWLTLTAHTSLDAVGVSAAVTTALAMTDIPCNVVAGYHHDHLLVPVDRADEAIAAIEELQRQRPPRPPR